MGFSWGGGRLLVAVVSFSPVSRWVVLVLVLLLMLFRSDSFGFWDFGVCSCLFGRVFLGGGIS